MADLISKVWKFLEEKPGSTSPGSFFAFFCAIFSGKKYRCKYTVFSWQLDDENTRQTGRCTT